jgi:TANFOR domain-containing protein
MRTHSEKVQRNQNSCLTLKTAAFLIAMLIAIAGMAQFAPVRINIAITPPYSTKLSDYTNNPNKVLVTLQNFSIDGVTLRVYLKGEITGSSGSRIFTHPNHRPAQPIVLQPNTPFMLNVNNIQDVFDGNSVVYEGVTEQEILYGNGLPEDDYIICLTAYDYDTDMMLSDEPPFGCSVPFSITNLEAPVIMQPFCHEHITPLVPQNVVISWTMPAGATPMVRYKIRMIEVSPDGHDINDAMFSQPPFFETEVTGNVFLYGPVQPSLVEGKTYAFMVTAVDPLGQLVFRNGGRSEICSFTWGNSDNEITNAFTPPNPAIANLPDDFEMAPITTISGKMMAKYPTNPNEPIDLTSLPNFNTPIDFSGQPVNINGMMGPTSGSGSETGNTSSNLNFSYAGINYVSNQVSGNINNHNIGYSFLTPDPEDQSVYPDLYALGWPLIAKMNSRRFIFADSENYIYTTPLPNTRIRLVARYGIINNPDLFGIQHGEYGTVNPLTRGIDLKGVFRGDANKYVNLVLAETVTDENGNFTFSFNHQFFTGPIVTTGIEHNAPATTNPNPLDDMFGAVVFPGVDLQNVLGAMPGIPGGSINAPAGGQQVMSMSGAIISNSEFGYLCLKIEVVNQKFCSPDIDVFAMPGDNLEIPVQVAKLKTYNLTVEVKSDSTSSQMNPPLSPMKGVKVQIMRKWTQVQNEVPIIIEYEGQQLGTKTVSSKGEFLNVATDTTGIAGIVRIENLVKHGYITPQYLIDLSVRDFDAVETAYDLTFYNYQDIFDAVPSSQENNAIQTFSGKVFYNHQYEGPSEIVARYQMKPLPPEIKGRVTASSDLETIGMPDVNIYLLNQANNTRLYSYSAFLNQCYSNTESFTTTNSSGFFRFTNLPVRDNNGNPVYRRILARPKLHLQEIRPRIGPPDQEARLPRFLRMGELVEMFINLSPISMMPGYVEDEDGEPVAAYVKSAHSPYYKTEKVITAVNPLNPSQSEYQEQFSVPADPQAGATVSVVPLSSIYFPRDTTFIPHGNSIGIKVYKRLHRPQVTIRNELNQPIPGAIVNIGGHTDTTDASGQVQMKFAAASDQFVLRITPPAGFSPLQSPVNIPATSYWYPLTYTLTTGKSIRGIVTEQQSNTPVAGVRVFAELVNTNGLPLFIEATTNSQGAYYLGGIPRNLYQLDVLVVKEGNNPSYIGTTRTITFPAQMSNQPPTHNFTIQKTDDWDLSRLWGFPIVVTSLKNKFLPGTTTMSTFLSGYLVNPPTAANFTILQNDMKVPFRGIRITKGSNNRPEPVNEILTVDALEIPVIVGQHYSGHLYNYAKPPPGNTLINLFGFNKKKLKIEKITFGSGGARIRGQVKLDLASFELLSQFSGILYLGSDTITGQSTVFTSALTSQIATGYKIFSLNNNLQPVPVRNYKVFNFNASADLSHSELNNGIILLRTILHTQLPGGGTNSNLDLKIRAGDLVINNTEIYFRETPGGQLSFDLDQWKVASTKPWRFDINEDALVLEEVLINTGSGVDAIVKNMKVRPNELREGQISLSGGFTLGGVAPVELPPGAEPVFNFDEGTGNYSISIIGNNNLPAGTVRNLQNTSPDRFVLESVSMLSNNTQVISIDQPMRFYNILDMEVGELMSGPGFFALKGVPIINIPGYDPPSAIVRYERVNNRITPTVEPLIGTVFTHGNVEFELAQTEDRQKTTNEKFTSYGRIKINPAADDPAGEPVYFTGYLTKTPTDCDIEIIKVNNNNFIGNTMQLMPAGSNQLPVETGSMIVKAGSWKPLTYTCLTNTIDGLDNAGNNDENRLDFTVNGAITAVSQDDISVTGIDTPLGDMNLTYNFAEGSLLGNLNVNNLTLGYATIYEGGATLRLDKKGFYMLLDMHHFAIGIMDGFKGGMLVGKTNGVVQSDLYHVRSNFRYDLPAFDAGFTGIYIIGEKEIAKENLNLIVMEFNADLGLGMSLNLNFQNQSEINVAGYSYCDLFNRTSYGIPVTGPDCGIWVDTKLYSFLTAEYAGGSYGLNACGSLKFGCGFDGVCGYVLDEIGLSHYMDVITNQINMKINAGYNSVSGFSVGVTPFATCD